MATQSGAAGACEPGGRGGARPEGAGLVALDVSELTSFADTFVIATGTSDRHVRAIADAVVEARRPRAARSRSASRATKRRAGC